MRTMVLIKGHRNKWSSEKGFKYSELFLKDMCLETNFL